MTALASPLLSIVIPTYNRSVALGQLLDDVENILGRKSHLVQVVICDNHSTDETPALIERFRARWPVAAKVVVRAVNLGMEGNIACAMLEGDGKYIWTLSDHQRICIDSAIQAVDSMQAMEFDVAHAKLVQWSAALPSQKRIYCWDEIPALNRGALLFSLGNLSTLIFRREIAGNSMKSIFRACCWSYPHLGVISGMNSSTRIVEFDNLSSLPEGRTGPALVHDYDKLTVRFHSNAVCVDTLAAAAGLEFNRRGFFTPEYRAAFRAEVLNFLLQDTGVTARRTWRTLWPVIKVNPGALRLTALFVLMAMLCIPRSIRTRAASTARAWIMRYRSAALT